MNLEVEGRAGSTLDDFLSAGGLSGQIPLPMVLRELVSLGYQGDVTYRALHAKVLDGVLPAMQIRGRWHVRRSDLAAIADAMGMAVLASAVVIRRLSGIAGARRNEDDQTAEATLRAFEKNALRWRRWCKDRGCEPVPCAVEDVVDHVACLVTEGKKIRTIRQRVWAISRLHQVAGFLDPTKTQAAKEAVRKAALQLGTVRRQVNPLTEREIRQILAAAGSGIADLRNVALVLVMRDLLARPSEAITMKVEDVEKEWGRLSPRTARAMNAWLKAAELADGAAFRSVNKGGRVGGPLDGSNMRRILKKIAEAAGIDPARISGMSCRRGMACDLADAGAGLSDLMAAGRWQDPAMPAEYLGVDNTR